MLAYLLASSRPDLGMAVHQCARFCVDPKITHERAVMQIEKYLLGTKDKGLQFTSDVKRELSVLWMHTLLGIGIKLMPLTQKMYTSEQDM